MILGSIGFLTVGTCGLKSQVLHAGLESLHQV